MDHLSFYFFCRITMAMGFALAVGDMASTVRAVYYGAREANPGWRYVLKNWGTPAFMVGRVSLGLFVVWLGVSNAYAPFSMWSIIFGIIPLLILGYAVQNNWRKGDVLREKARSEYR